MKLALQLVGLICLGSAAIHLATGFRTEFAFSMIGVAVCAIGVGYIDYSRRRNQARREAVWARRMQRPGVMYLDVRASSEPGKFILENPRSFTVIDGGKERN